MQIARRCRDEQSASPRVVLFPRSERSHPSTHKDSSRSGLRAIGKKLAGQVHRDRLRFARWHAHIFDDSLPIALGVLHLQVRGTRPPLPSCARRGTCCRRPNPPSRSGSAPRCLSWRRSFRNPDPARATRPRLSACAESVGVGAIASCEHVLPCTSRPPSSLAATGYCAALHAEQPEFRERRTI